MKITRNREKIINGHTVTQYYHMGQNMVYIDGLGTCLTFFKACKSLQGTQDKRSPEKKDG